MKSKMNKSKMNKMSKFAKRVDDVLDRPDVKKVLSFTKNCAEDLLKLRDNPNAIDYIYAGFAITKQYRYIFQKPLENFVSLTEDKYVSNTIYKFIQLMDYPVNKKRFADTDQYTIELNDQLFGWARGALSPSTTWIYTNVPCDVAQKTIIDEFWAHYDNAIAVTWDAKGDGGFIVSKDHQNTYYTSERSDALCRKIRRYRDLGICHSMLFYGPPGSGKSNLVKSVAKTLGVRTIRLPTIANIPLNIVHFVNFFNPDILIIEDLDSQRYNAADFLDHFDNFAQNGKIVFATANVVSLLPDNVLRPGRFSETMEINKLEDGVILKMVDGDEDVFRLVCDFPAIYIIEVQNRIKAFGKEEALRSISDVKSRVERLSRTNYTMKS